MVRGTMQIAVEGCVDALCDLKMADRNGEMKLLSIVL